MPYCTLCQKDVDQLHYDIEQWVLNTIQHENPHWVEKDGSCVPCIKYYEALSDIKISPS